jgi:hypothetical protein
VTRRIDRATLDAAVLGGGLVHGLATSHACADPARRWGSLRTPRYARLRCHRRSVRRGHDPLSTVMCRNDCTSSPTRLTRTGLCTMWTTARVVCPVRHMPVRNFERRVFVRHARRRLGRLKPSCVEARRLRVTVVSLQPGPACMPSMFEAFEFRAARSSAQDAMCGGCANGEHIALQPLPFRARQGLPAAGESSLAGRSLRDA